MINAKDEKFYLDIRSIPLAIIEIEKILRKFNADRLIDSNMPEIDRLSKDRPEDSRENSDV